MDRRVTRSLVTDDEMQRILELLHLNPTGVRLADLNTSMPIHISDERVLTPTNQYNSVYNTLVESTGSSRPSPDEIVIRQRGRKKFPANVSWSPIKKPSPLKTPTKKISTHHLSLLSPTPEKKLNKSSPMILRSTPKKRLLLEMPASPQTPTKRLRYEERSLNAGNRAIGLNTLLSGLSNNQLINIISDITRNSPELEDHIRRNLPLPDLSPMEDELARLKKYFTKGSPRSRLLSKTDGNAFSRAAFKKTIFDHCKNLCDSQHFDALLDYIKIAWNYVRWLPDQNSKRDCFKILTSYAKLALKSGGVDLQVDRLNDFKNQLKMMIADHEEANKCEEILDNLLKTIQSGYNNN